MKIVIITAAVAVSLAFTAYASLPPASGSPEWEEIEMNLGPSPQNEGSVCQSTIPGSSGKAHVLAKFSNVTIVR